MTIRLKLPPLCDLEERLGSSADSVSKMAYHYRSTVEREVGLSGFPHEEGAESARLAVLRLLEVDAAMSQRDLSRALGISLGKTHYVIHALLDRGLVKMGNFRRSDNKLAYAYVLTPSGIREKVRLSRLFLARKEAEFRSLKQTIDLLRREVGRGGGGQ